MVVFPIFKTNDVRFAVPDVFNSWQSAFGWSSAGFWQPHESNCCLSICSYYGWSSSSANPHPHYGIILVFSVHWPLAFKKQVYKNHLQKGGLVSMHFSTKAMPAKVQTGFHLPFQSSLQLWDGQALKLILIETTQGRSISSIGIERIGSCVVDIIDAVFFIVEQVGGRRVLHIVNGGSFPVGDRG